MEKLSVQQTVTRLVGAGYKIIEGSYEVCPTIGIEAAVQKSARWNGPVPRSFYDLGRQVDGGHLCSNGFITVVDLPAEMATSPW